jgi:hypothetical protein
MIGVIADPTERRVISEFFELFKTPWQFYQSGERYEVLLCVGHRDFSGDPTRLVLIYASGNLPINAGEKIEIASRRNAMLMYKGYRIPIYGDCTTFYEDETDLLLDEESRESAIHHHQSPRRLVVRIGYDLFSEINILLEVGQPAAYASIPALDLHIALLRKLIISNGIRLIEIPPVPDGYRCIACLTHDIDHPSICLHKWDHTMFGFVYRAILVSLVNLFLGRIPVRDLFKNWVSVLKLPFIYLGSAKDFWCDFDDRYLELEKGLSSTFFVIPFKDNPGHSAPAFRAARYGAKDIACTIKKILAAGCEVGLHGIDAWLDSTKGRKELEEIRQLTGELEIGVRMHWLYYSQQSATALESAEATYDSTIGYKETVGYHAGTMQVYKPLQVDRLLELPLHVMDTALFYPAYMGLSQEQATKVLRRLIDNVSHFGGCITTNWHDRSLAPERLWETCYRDLLQDLKDTNAWFATARQAVSWFQQRRSAVFETDGVDADSVRAKITDAHNGLPGLRLRIHNARNSYEIGPHNSEDFFDMPFNESTDGQAPYALSR